MWFICIFQSVIKSVVKRFIFESQKHESSPIEIEVEELKQDLSSFRFEMLNKTDTQWRALMDSLKALNTRLESIPKPRYGRNFGMTSRAPSFTQWHCFLCHCPLCAPRVDKRCPFYRNRPSVHEKQSSFTHPETSYTSKGNQNIWKPCTMNASDSQYIEKNQAVNIPAWHRSISWLGTHSWGPFY